jgi:excisionase family DNA binding protein
MSQVTVSGFVDIEQYAEITGMSVSWLRRQVLDRKIRFYRCGRRILFNPADAAALVQAVEPEVAEAVAV